MLEWGQLKRAQPLVMQLRPSLSLILNLDLFIINGNQYTALRLVVLRLGVYRFSLGLLVMLVILAELR